MAMLLVSDKAVIAVGEEGGALFVQVSITQEACCPTEWHQE